MSVVEAKKSEVDQNPYDRLMRRAWQNVRRAMQLCELDEQARLKSLDFAQRARRVSPPVMQRWIEILNGSHQEHLVMLRQSESFTRIGCFGGR